MSIFIMNLYFFWIEILIFGFENNNLEFKYEFFYSNLKIDISILKITIKIFKNIY
jgi:hypothetical protein